MRLNLRRLLVACWLLQSAASSGCSSPNAGPPSQSGSSARTATAVDRPFRVVTTFLPVYLFTKAVAGDAAKVNILIKPGTEVHEYQSTPTDVQTIARADVVVKNGLGIEEFLDNTIKTAENPKLKVIDASQGIQPIAAISPVVQPQGDVKEADRAHTHAAGNPHVWLDPVLAQKQVETIRDGLMAADPTHQQTYRVNAAAYIQKLSDLNRQFEQGLKGVRDRTFVTFHDAFPYLAKRYQLQQVAVVSLPEDQLSPGDVQNAVSAVKQYKVKALFSEPGVDNKLLASLSTDLQLTLRPLDSLEAGQLDPQYYFTAMQNNLKTLEAAFR